MTSDILSRLSKETTIELSPALEAKVKAVAKSRRRVVRLVSDAEAEELVSQVVSEVPGWFMYNGAQVVVRRRENGQVVVYKL